MDTFSVVILVLVAISAVVAGYYVLKPEKN